MSTGHNNVNNALAVLRQFPNLKQSSLALGHVWRLLPTLVKYASFALLLLNIRSLPLAWHFRVFRPVYLLRFRYYWLRLCILFKSRQAKEAAVEKWFESIAPIGLNPLEATTTYKSWASFDDADFNGHLSNSSYAKTNDTARFEMALSYFPSFFRTGGWIALGATHYHFLREIPILQKYEVRSRLVGWDNKWVFVVGRFVSHSKPKKSNNASTKSRGEATPPSDTSLSVNTTFQASLRTSGDGLETPATPLNAIRAPQSDMKEATEAMKLIAAAQLKNTEESDGATLHCISISQLCYKHGRITVPPTLVLAASGFSAPPPASPSSDSPPTPYSHANPPPHFHHAKTLISPRATRKYREFLRGGWRNVPEAERWWDNALGGVVEERRKANVEGLGGVNEPDGPMSALRRGMEGAKGV